MSSSPSHSASESSLMDHLNDKLGELGNAAGKLFSLPLEAAFGQRLWGNGHHHSAEGTDQLNRSLQLNHVAGEIVCEKLGCTPEQLPYSENLISDLHLLSLVLLSPETTEDARYEIQKELKKQLAGVRLAGGDESEDRYRHEIDHAWEGVFHWTHTLLSGGLAQNTASEKPLYLKALRRPPEGGDIRVKAQAFSNPKLAQILFPELLEQRAAEKAEHSGELIMKEVGDKIGYLVNRVRKTTSTRIVAIDDSQEDEDHSSPEMTLSKQEKIILLILVVASAGALVTALSMLMKD